MLKMTLPGEYVLGQMLEEASRQGHTLSGRLKKESRVVTYGTPGVDDLLGVQVLMPPYATQLNNGVKRGKVPFASSRTRNRNRGGTSAYIQALQDFFAKRYPSATTARAKELAFKTARVAKKVGHPTPGSYKYSTNNARTGFIENTIAKTSLNVLETKMGVRKFVTDSVTEKLLNFRFLTTGRTNG